MTTERDFDRIARAWLELMPDEAPDRTIAAVLQAVEAAPQVRRISWPTWRFTPMYRLPIVLGAVAVVAIAGTLLFSRAGAPPGPGASGSLPPTGAPNNPASVAVSSSTPAVDGSLPTELQARWMRGHTGIVAADAGTTLLLAPTSVGLAQSNTSNATILSADARATSADHFELTTNAGPGGCAADAVGTYAWSRSASGRTLTITVGTDPCAVRSAAVAGTWSRMGCKDPVNPCLGPLDGGPHDSQFVDPHLPLGAAWSPAVGRISYVVPDGWANSADWPTTFGLTPASVYAASDGEDIERGIFLATQPQSVDRGHSCDDLVRNDAGRSVADLVADLESTPGLAASAPKSITIGGHPGRWLDLAISPDWTTTCPGLPTRISGAPFVEYLAPGLGVAATERHRVILLDLGGGDVAVIQIWAPDSASFDAFVAQAMPIVESYTFK